MRLNRFIHEGKKITNPMIGFGFKYADIKNTVEYIESKLTELNIKYQEPDDYHLSLAMLIGKYDKDELVRVTNDIKLDFKLTPVGIKVLRGKRVPKDFIVIEYKPNDKFVKDFRDIDAEYETFSFSKIIPHISLFTVNNNTISDKMMLSLKEGVPKMKKVTPTEVQIWDSKHEKVYIT